MKRCLWVLLCFAPLLACQMAYVPQARDIKRKPRNSGVIAIPTAQRTEDRQRAEELMKQNCAPLPFQIVDEGETVIGQEAKSNVSETNRDDTRRNEGQFLGMNLISGSNAGKETSQSSVTTQLKEWQIAYNCEAEKTVSNKTKK